MRGSPICCTHVPSSPRLKTACGMRETKLRADPTGPRGTQTHTPRETREQGSSGTHSVCLQPGAERNPGQECAHLLPCPFLKDLIPNQKHLTAHVHTAASTPGSSPPKWDSTPEACSLGLCPSLTSSDTSSQQEPALVATHSPLPQSQVRFGHGMWPSNACHFYVPLATPTG